MKLVRYGAPGREKPGMIDKDGKLRDLSKIVPDIAGDVLSPRASTSSKSSSRKNCRRCTAIRASAPCVGQVGNFIAIGLNYSDHAAEAGMPIPKEPIIFNKAPSCICGPNDDTMTRKAPPSSTGKSSSASSSASPRAI